MRMSKRYEVNGGLEKSVADFVYIAEQVLKGTKVINEVNYDLRKLTTEESVEFLQITVDSTQVVKKNWILLSQALNEVKFCIDWYSNRCNMDLKRYRRKLHGERENPRDDQR